MITLTGPDASSRRIAAVGMFDGVHLGHRFLINHVRQLAGDHVPSVVTFSSHPLTLVRPDAVPAQLSLRSERLALLEQAGVEHCILLDFNQGLRQMSAAEFLSMLTVHYGVSALVVGFNNRFGHDRLEGLDAYQAIGSKIGMEIIPAPEYRHADSLAQPASVSSSIIRRLISLGDVEAAAKLLGRPFSLGGTVGHGKRLGRTIGFPTANLIPDPAIIVPAPGVYACRVSLPDGSSHPAMVNIGSRPTVDAPGAPLSIEAHILDFSGDLYGSRLSLQFIARMRPEQRFDSLDLLTDRLRADAAETRRIIAVSDK